MRIHCKLIWRIQERNQSGEPADTQELLWSDGWLVCVDDVYLCRFLLICFWIVTSLSLSVHTKINAKTNLVKFLTATL